MFDITIEDEFAAAHHLNEYQGNCRNLHGHNWRVQLTVRCDQLDKSGLGVDFRKIRTILGKILKELDHSYLNDHPAFKEINPTCENISVFVFRQAAQILLLDPDKPNARVHAVTIWESGNCRVTYRENNSD